MAFLLTVLWAERIVQGMSGHVAGLLHGETTMTIQALDLGLVVPASVVIAVLALRRNPAGLAAAAAFAVTFTAMSAAIGSMLVSAWLVTGNLELPPIVVFGLAAVGGLAIGLRMYASAQTDGVLHAADAAPSSARRADLPAPS